MIVGRYLFEALLWVLIGLAVGAAAGAVGRHLMTTGGWR